MYANMIQQFLPGYPAHLHAQGQLETYLKQRYLKNAPLLDKLYFDNQLTIEKQTLGLNTAISRVQGGKLKAKKEIRISAFFKSAPLEFLKMIVVHELVLTSNTFFSEYSS